MLFFRTLLFIVLFFFFINSYAVPSEKYKVFFYWAGYKNALRIQYKLLKKKQYSNTQKSFDQTRKNHVNINGQQLKVGFSRFLGIVP